MKINLDDCYGLKPIRYGRDLLKRMEVNSYYVNEYDVIDFLGYEVKEIELAKYNWQNEFIDVGAIFDDVDAILMPNNNKILISKNTSSNRKRYSLFHEAGHVIIPYHQANYFSVSKNEVFSLIHKRMEKEAFLAGSELMFPYKYFMVDSMSLPLSFSSIKELASKYRSSFEATCIRYALTNRNMMAIVIIKENDISEQIISNTINAINDNSNKQLKLLHIPKAPQNKSSDKAPLRVQYCVSSFAFPQFIKSGLSIKEDNVLYNWWSQKENKNGEISSTDFGSSKKRVYFAESLPVGNRRFVLLWLPNRQSRLF